MEAVIIMAKEPIVGKVKTRLIPPLSPKTASQLYYNFLLDKIEALQSMENIQPFLAYYPDSGLNFFLKIVGADFKLIKQEGRDLGERLANISSAIIEYGYSKVLMLDSDSPNLPISYIQDGLEELNSTDAVLGPCEDGGYYLIGIKSKIPELFKDVPWSTAYVTESTLKRADEFGLNITMLKQWYDVDTIEELERLKKDLSRAKGSEHNQFYCKNTKKFLDEILNSETN